MLLSGETPARYKIGRSVSSDLAQTDWKYIQHKSKKNFNTVHSSEMKQSVICNVSMIAAQGWLKAQDDSSMSDEQSVQRYNCQGNPPASWPRQNGLMAREEVHRR